MCYPLLSWGRGEGAGWTETSEGEKADGGGKTSSVGDNLLRGDKDFPSQCQCWVVNTTIGGDGSGHAK